MQTEYSYPAGRLKLPRRGHFFAAWSAKKRSFFMNKFRRLGFIEYNGVLSVHSSLLNVVLHD
jgi:hypothetical protein